MKTLTQLSAFFVGSLMLLAVFSPALTISSLITAPTMSVAGINGNSYTSLNWSGYAVTGSAGSVTSASGSWIVPAVTGASNSYAAFWTGIDGFSDSTVEQTGTISYMNGATPAYYAWYEFYPSPMYEITSVPIVPTNVISASVTYIGSHEFTLSLTDVTTGATFSKTITDTSAKMTSAEWIVEAPSSNSGILPLADFKTAKFGNAYTSVPSTCYATVGTTTGPIGNFGTAVQTINMVTNRGVLKDSTSALSTDGTSFYVTWDSSGSSGIGPFGFGR
jgi:hypothetical protein